MSTKVSIEVGDGIHLYSEAFETEEKAYLEVKGKKVIYASISGGEPCVVIELSGDLLALLRQDIIDKVKANAKQSKETEEYFDNFAKEIQDKKK